MNRDKAKRYALKIYDSITPRLIEMAKRFEKKEVTHAYIPAFQIGLLADIENVLRRIK
jgi:hypothetical protein